MRPHRYVKSGLLLSGGSVASSMCSFARNIIVARLISVDNFGIASTLALTMSLVEMASNLSLDRLIVQDPDGDSPRLQATAHAFQAVRGMLGGVLLFLLAGPAAALFDIPEVRWAFQTLAVVPVVRGFAHLDFARAQRSMSFGPSVWIDLIPQAAVTALAAPLAIWLGDYRVMLWTALLQIVAYVAISHLAARRAYRWAWDTRLIRRMLRFGWPLLVNGLLLFGIFQGDRAIVGASFDMETLGWFSAAFALTLTPSQVLTRVCQSYLMPLLSRVQSQPRAFVDRADLTVQTCLAVGMLVAVGFWIAGPALLLMLFGERYADGATAIGLIGLMQGVRVAKAGPFTTAISRGDTLSPMLANSVRILGLGLAVAAAFDGRGIPTIIACGLCGEGAALVASLWLLHSRLRLPIGAMLRACGSAVILALIVLLPTRGVFVGKNPWFELPLGSFCAMIVVLIFARVSPQLRAALKAVLAIRVHPGLLSAQAPSRADLSARAK